jgi:hypothetical protein
MATRQATVLVADEIFFNLYGKAVLQGIYTTDLIINADPTLATQLVFFFIAETDISDPFRSLSVEVTLPATTPIRQSVPVQWPIPAIAEHGRTRIFVRWPLLIPAPLTLHPGRIEAKVIHENGEIEVGAPWILLNPAGPPSKAN